MNEKKILLATSIAPYEIDNQKQAVSSWLDAGFDVVSLNTSDEIKIVESYFPEINFIPLSRDGQDIFGKPYPYIYDMMQFLLSTEYDVTGIINSDIHMLNFTPDLVDVIYDEALKGTLIHGHRMETKTMSWKDCLDGKIYQNGIDLFFFNKSLLSLYEDEGFLIGNCMWDYWVPIVAYAKGVPQKEIKNLCLWHISHTIRWDKDLLKKFTQRLADKYFSSDTSLVYHYYSTHMVTLNNGVFYECPKYHNKKVICIIPRNITKESIDSLRGQTHPIKIIEETEFDESVLKDFDYVFYAKQGHIYDNSTVEITLQEMDIRKSDKAILGASFVCEESEGSNYWLHMFCIVDTPMIERVEHQYGGKTCKLGFAFSNISNQFYVQKKLSKLGKIVIYPAGNETDYLLRENIRNKINLKIVALSDKDSTKWGTKQFGYEIVSPCSLKNIEFDYVVVNSFKYGNEIKEELSKFLPKEKIVSLFEFIDYSDPDWVEKNEDMIRAVLR